MPNSTFLLLDEYGRPASTPSDVKYFEEKCDDKYKIYNFRVMKDSVLFHFGLGLSGGLEFLGGTDGTQEV